jgi:ADP-heptose:LPS heptosyltransferase
MEREPILIIKHGALGDFIQATACFAAIRRHHPRAHIVLLTTKPYAALAWRSPYFDDVWLDSRPKPWQFAQLLHTFRALNGAALGKPFSRIYDLQTSRRTTRYFQFLLRAPKPEWSGIAPGCSHRHDTPQRTALHTLARDREQLAFAGIDDVGMPDISWLRANVARFQLPPRYALIVAGCSTKHHNVRKRWSADGYAALARWLWSQGIAPVCIGTQSEAEVVSEIEVQCASKPPVNLLGQTDFADIAELARGALVAVGNDTGPMHIAAAAGCKLLMLLSGASDPAFCLPPGEHVRMLREEVLPTLPPQRVIEAVKAMLA